MPDVLPHTDNGKAGWCPAGKNCSRDAAGIEGGQADSKRDSFACLPGGSVQYKVRKPVLVMLYKYRFRFLCRVTHLTFEIQDCTRYNGAIPILEGFL